MVSVTFCGYMYFEGFVPVLVKIFFGPRPTGAGSAYGAARPTGARYAFARQLSQLGLEMGPVPARGDGDVAL